MEFNVRKLSCYSTSKRYNIEKFNLEEVVDVFSNFVKDNLQYPYNVYIENETIVVGKELIFAFKNLDKIFINKENLNIHLDKNCKNSFCFNTIIENLQDIIYKREEKYKTENNYEIIEEKANQDWEKHKHLIRNFNKKSKEYSLSENFKELRDIASKCYSNCVVIIELY